MLTDTFLQWASCCDCWNSDACCLLDKMLVVATMRRRTAAIGSTRFHVVSYLSVL